MTLGPEGGSGGGNTPDWAVIGGAIATVLTVVGGIVAGMLARFRGKASEDDERRSSRDKDATANAALTLDSVFKLVNELQEEVDRKSKEVERVERVCLETKATLLVRIGELEAEIRTCKETQSDLEQRIRTLREQLQRPQEL